MKTDEIIAQIQKAIVGKDDVIKSVLTAILAGGNVLIEDVPGVGKTTLAIAFSKALGFDCRRIQFTPDTMPSDILGFSVFNKAKNELVYQPGPVITNLLLADEINRTSSKTQAALLEVMEEKHVTVDGETHALPEPFVVLATQNPLGSAGTQPLPPSQLDRFMIRISMGYPSFKSQVEILKDRHTSNPLDTVEQIVTKSELISMQHKAAQVFVADALYEYITRLAEATRTHSDIELGISPRGALAVCKAAKAYAFINGREYVIPQDVKEVFHITSAHRLVLSRRARISDCSAQKVIDEILTTTPMPAIESEEKLKL